MDRFGIMSIHKATLNKDGRFIACMGTSGRKVASFRQLWSEACRVAGHRDIFGGYRVRPHRVGQLWQRKVCFPA